MALFERLFRKSTSKGNSNVMLAKGRGYTFEIVGESYFQAEIARVAGRKTERGFDMKTTAQLVFDGRNSADQNAIKVMLAG